MALPAGMWVRKGAAAMSLVAATLLAASHVSAFAIRGSVVASGGSSSTPAGDATHRVFGTAGQPAVGTSGEGTVVCSGFWSFSGVRMVASPPHSDPKVFSFALVSSNPMRGPALFELALPRASRVTLSVWDVSGRRIGDPLEQRFEAGRYRLTWGANLRRSGVYFLRLTSEVGFEAKRKIVLVR
jgi:hypothetical protein